MTRGIPTTRRETLAGLAALSVAACGGGGSGTPVVGSSPAPTPPPPAPAPAPTVNLNTLAARKGRRWGSAIAWNSGTGGGSIQNPD